jgi:hypothetical protein
MTVVLDAGALIAIDRRDRRVGAMLRLVQAEGIPVRTSGAVVAQVWRDGRTQANLARALRGVEVVGLDAEHGRRVGELLAESRTSDVVDGHVALLADPIGQVLTSDPDELTALLAARRVDATVVTV